MIGRDKIIGIKEQEPGRSRDAGARISRRAGPLIFLSQKPEAFIALTPDRGVGPGEVRGSIVDDDCFPVLVGLARDTLKRSVQRRGGIESRNNDVNARHRPSSDHAFNAILASGVPGMNTGVLHNSSLGRCIGKWRTTSCASIRYLPTEDLVPEHRGRGIFPDHSSNGRIIASNSSTDRRFIGPAFRSGFCRIKSKGSRKNPGGMLKPFSFT